MNRFRIISLFSTAVALALGAAIFPGNRLHAEDGAAALLPAPAWKLKDLDGREVSSAQFKGKVVVVDFWATWCGPCISEIPGYVALQKKYGAAGLVIVGVSVDRKGPEWVKKFVQENGMNYTVVMGDDGIADAFGGFDAIPTTFLISRSGRILNKKIGAVPPEEYEKLVQQALN
jgi:thiol-disulfide isomerase/thioredoxin